MSSLSKLDNGLDNEAKLSLEAIVKLEREAYFAKNFARYKCLRHFINSSLKGVYKTYHSNGHNNEFIRKFISNFKNTPPNHLSYLAEFFVGKIQKTKRLITIPSEGVRIRYDFVSVKYNKRRNEWDLYADIVEESYVRMLRQHPRLELIPIQKVLENMIRMAQPRKKIRRWIRFKNKREECSEYLIFEFDSRISYDAYKHLSLSHPFHKAFSFSSENVQKSYQKLFCPWAETYSSKKFY